MKYIFIGAHARSGSTFFCNLLEQINEIKVYYEIFHFNLKVVEHHLWGDYPEVANRLRLSDDPNEARSNLVLRHKEYLETLAILNDEKLMAFKVFPKHLADMRLNGVIKNSSLVVLLRRNLLHSYISNVISTKLDKWGGLDTSMEKAIFSVESFRKHMKNVVTYETTVNSLAKDNNKKLLIIDYEA